MQKSIKWSYRPYKPFFFDSGDIYICRIAPGKNYVELEWLGDESAEYEVFYTTDDEHRFSSKKVKGCRTTLTGLFEIQEYKIYVQCGDKKSRVRTVITGEVPGTVINYLNPDDKAYSFSGSALCSPSFVRHPDGYLLSSMDVFELNAPQNLTLIFRSDDDGKTWRYVTDLFPCYWGKLFIHKGDVYMISTSTEYGDLLIGRSTDGGNSFEAPTVLLRGSCSNKKAGVHRSPQNIIYHKGRLYVTFEWGAWNEGYHAAMYMSCDENADLLDCDSWTITHPLKYSEDWEGVAKGHSHGCIEGTPIVAPDGRLLNIMRYDTPNTVPNYGLVLAYEIDTDDPSSQLRYSHAIKLPGNMSKFMIKKDEKTGEYYTMISRITDANQIRDRSLLSLMKSKDLDNWELVTDVFDYRHLDRSKNGFNYIAFEIEGDDIIFQSRTALNFARNYHDANYATFHRIENFRDIGKK